MTQTQLTLGLFLFSVGIGRWNAAVSIGNIGGDVHPKTQILRLKGWVLMRQGRRTEAETQLRASIECARRQQARSWELRSSTTLARWFVECGQRDEARQLLVPIYNWFGEGFETHDLKAARALLDEI